MAIRKRAARLLSSCSYDHLARVEVLEDRRVLAVQFGFALDLGGASFDQGHGVAPDSSGNVYVTGEFQGTVDFDPSTVVANLTSNGLSDAFLAKYSNTGAFVWAIAIGSTGTDVGHSVAVDSGGNVYVTGEFRNTVDFDPVGTANLSSAGGGDIFVAKYTTTGAFVWANSAGAASDDSGNAITLDAYNNVYVTGAFQGTVDFDSGVGTANLTSAGLNDAFVLRTNSNGAFSLALRAGGTGDDAGHAIIVDSAVNMEVGLTFSGTVDFDPGTAVANLVSAGNLDVAIWKLDLNGSLVWARRVGGTSVDNVNDIDVDPTGSILITGAFNGTVDFNPGTAVNNLTSTGLTDAYALKLDAGGNYAWAIKFGASSADAGMGAEFDNIGQVYLTGTFQDTVDFNPGTPVVSFLSHGSTDFYLVKLTGDASFLLARQIGGTGAEVGGALALDAASSIYMTGSFRGTVDFDPNSGVANRSSLGGDDAFLLKLIQPTDIVVTGADAGGGPHVRVFDAQSLVQRLSFFAYSASFTGGVRVAAGDVTGDGIADIITGAGPGGGPHVRVFDGRTGLQTLGAIGSFMAFASTFTGGVFVASGDVDNDGRDDVIVGSGAGMTATVRAFSGLDGHQFYSITPYGAFSGGVRVGSGDVDANGVTDVISTPGPGIVAQVRIFTGTTGTVIRNFNAFPTTYTGGAYVAAGDTTGDGASEIFVGQEAGSTVKIFSPTGTALFSFDAYPGFGGGARVGAADLDGNGTADLLTAAGPGGGPHVRGFRGSDLVELFGFFAYASSFTGGVFISGTVSGVAAGNNSTVVAPASSGSSAALASSPRASATDAVLTTNYDPRNDELAQLLAQEQAASAKKGDHLFGWLDL